MYLTEINSNAILRGEVEMGEIYVIGVDLGGAKNSNGTLQFGMQNNDPVIGNIYIGGFHK